MLFSNICYFTVICIHCLKLSSANNFLDELKSLAERTDDFNDNECYAYADAHQLQMLYEMEERDRQLWYRISHYKACVDDRPVMYNATAKDDYCKIHLHPVVIDSENLENVAIAVKLDTSFRSSSHSEWCIKVHTWMAPSFKISTIALRSRVRRSSSEVSGLTRLTQKFHNEWANQHVNHCPPVNNLNDGHMFCVPLNGSNRALSNERDASEMTEDEINSLQRELFQMIDHERVVSHYRLSCDLLSFFYGHRSYLSCVRNHLYLKGIHLPMWKPSSGYVPSKLQAVKHSPFACLASIKCHDGWLDIPFEPNAKFDLDLPEKLKPENICSNSFYELHNVTTLFHHQVHALVGGIFYSFDSPASLLFYIYHNWIDREILQRWENCSEENKNTRSKLIQSMNL